MKWSQVVATDEFIGKDGRQWIVEKVEGDRVTCRRHPDGLTGTKTIDLNAEVEVVRRNDPSAILSDAIGAIEDILGGEVIAHQEPNGTYLVPAEYSHPGSLQAHYFMLHGIQPEKGANLAELQKQHTTLHDNRSAHPEGGWVEHVHTPNFARMPA